MFLLQTQACLLIKPIYLLMVHNDALPLEHHLKTAIPKTFPFGCQNTQALCDIYVFWLMKCWVSFSPPGYPVYKACPPFADGALLHDLFCFLPFAGGLDQFFETISFKILLSKLRSAANSLSLRFSASSSRRRLASLTSMPPNLLFQR